jgi:broad specificity phosphatase PhoE
MDSPTRLFLMRHGEVESRYHRVFGGRIDMDLSPFGREQADALATYAQKFPLDAIYASPMKRVQQTLQRLVQNQNKQPIIYDELREVDFGVWTGISWEDVNSRFQSNPLHWLDYLEGGLIAEAEPIAEFRKRIEFCLNRIVQDRPGRSVAVVCHGGVIRMFLSILLDLPLRKMAAFDVEYASLTIIDHLPQKSEIQLLNFTPWRDQA